MDQLVAENYVFVVGGTATLAVNPLPVVLEWTGTNFAYDEENPVPRTVTARVANTVNNDQVEVLTYTGNSATDKGTYTAIATSLNDPNYTLSGAATARHSWSIGVTNPSGGGGGGSSTTVPDTSTDSKHEVTIDKTPGGSVTVGGADNNTIIIKPNPGFEVADVIINGVNVGPVTEYPMEDGTLEYEISVTFREITDKKFIDVATKAWYHDTVYKAVDLGWFAGTGENTFSPFVTTSRGMIAAVLYRMELQPNVGEASLFNDVQTGQYYSAGITWAKTRGIIQGYDNGNFGPNDNVTREQLIAILYRYAQFKGFDMTKSTGIQSFADAGKVSGYAQTAMQWAVANKLIYGKGENNLDPQGYATRAEVATILVRFMETFGAIDIMESSTIQ